MKALVLAGGTGSRLRPLTLSMPQQLVAVANKPVLVHCLENIRSMGVTEVGVIVGDHAEQIEAAVGNGSDLGLRITYLRQDHPRGLAHCVLVAADFLGDDDFVMYLGDNVVVGDLAGVARQFRRERPDAHLLLAKVPDPRQYGVVDLGPDGKPRALVEKSSSPPSDLAIVGVYFFTSAVGRAARMVQPSERGELEITDAIQYMLTNGGTVSASVFPGLWKDTGSVDELLECNQLLLAELPQHVAGEIDHDTRVFGPVVIEAGARVTRSVLYGPAVIGAGSVVTDSRVGPYVSVGAGSTLVGITINDSILLERTTLRHLSPVSGSVIGRDTEVTSAAADSRQLILAANTRMNLFAE